MALGDTYNNNERKNYSPSVTSGYRFSNPESAIDKTSLSFTFWNKLLKVSIAPRKETEGDTNIFIYPGYKFKCIDCLITNFHLPQSTLLMLVSALSDRDTILKAYNEAVKEKYRFFSFGDAMFIK